LASLKNLAKFVVEIKKPNQTIYAGLIQNKFIYEKNKSKFVVSLHEEMMEYLLELKEKFTRYEISNIKNLSSKYELKLYEYIKSYQNMGTSFEITVEKLREILEISETDYQLFGNLNQKILAPAIVKINQNTDLFVVIKPIKENNRKIIKIRFIHGGKNSRKKTKKAV
jgi:plasmid replication initiation protein